MLALISALLGTQSRLSFFADAVMGKIRIHMLRFGVECLEKKDVILNTEKNGTEVDTIMRELIGRRCGLSEVFFSK